MSKEKTSRPPQVERFCGCMESVKQIDLASAFLFRQYMAEAMETRYRWDKRTRAHLPKNSRAKGRQLLRENVLQHCYTTALLALEVTIIENASREENDKLNLGYIFGAGFVHDIPELFRGDNYYWKKSEKDAKVEQNGFSMIVEKYPPLIRDILWNIYAITQPDYNKPLAEWTREQKFFKLVELIGYFERTVAECRAGNLNFAPVLVYHWKRGDCHDPLAFEKEFPVTVAHYFTAEIREDIEKFIANATGGVSS